jgi:hypothetical protein
MVKKTVPSKKERREKFLRKQSQVEVKPKYDHLIWILLPHFFSQEKPRPIVKNQTKVDKNTCGKHAWNLQSPKKVNEIASTSRRCTAADPPSLMWPYGNGGAVDLGLSRGEGSVF